MQRPSIYCGEHVESRSNHVSMALFECGQVNGQKMCFLVIYHILGILEYYCLFNIGVKYVLCCSKVVRRFVVDSFVRNPFVKHMRI